MFSKMWKLVEYDRYFMSWGEVTVYIHVKVEEPLEDDEAFAVPY